MPEENRVRRGPEQQREDVGPAVLERPPEARGQRGRRLEAVGGVFAHGEPASAALLDRRGDLRMAIESRVELVERDAVVSRAVRLPQEEGREAVGDALAHRHVVFRAAQCDHPAQLGAIELAVAIEIVDPEGEAPLATRTAVEQALHTRQERVGADAAIAIAPKHEGDAPREVMAPKAEAARDHRGVDPSIGSGRIAKGDLE